MKKKANSRPSMVIFCIDVSGSMGCVFAAWAVAPPSRASALPWARGETLCYECRPPQAHVRSTSLTSEHVTAANSGAPKKHISRLKFMQFSIEMAISRLVRRGKA